MRSLVALVRGTVPGLTSGVRGITITSITGALVAGTVACSGTSIEWGAVTYPPHPPRFPPEPTVAVQPPRVCPGSFRAAQAKGEMYGTWWAVRPDSSAALMASRSVDGGRTWVTPVPAETLDTSRRGCARPAPSIFADTNGYVHFAYFAEAREGPGVFVTHTMNGRQMGVGTGIFHSPVVIVYGDRPSNTSVAAAGDTVAVAYEDPNSERPQVALALSRTTGHIFEIRVPVSFPDLSAAEPRVALDGRNVTVVWHERPDSMQTGGRIAVRTGRWR